MLIICFRILGASHDRPLILNIQNTEQEPREQQTSVRIAYSDDVAAAQMVVLKMGRRLRCWAGALKTAPGSSRGGPKLLWYRGLIFLGVVPIVV